MNAARHDQLAVVKLLLSHNAQVNVQNSVSYC